MDAIKMFFFILMIYIVKEAKEGKGTEGGNFSQYFLRGK